MPYDAPTAVLSSVSSRCTRPGPCSSSWGARVTRQVCRLYGVTEMQDFHHHCYVSGNTITKTKPRLPYANEEARSAPIYVAYCFQVGPENSCFG